MCKKFIAIGNRIMADDGIGVCLAEYLKEDLIKLGYEVIIGETDVDYCLDMISDVAADKAHTGDDLVIIDACDFALEPGTVCLVASKPHCHWLDASHIHNCATSLSPQADYSLHSLNLLQALDLYKNYKSLKLIGIQVSSIELSTELSDTLKEKFQEICFEVLQLIHDFIL